MSSSPDPLPDALRQRLLGCRELPTFPAAAVRLVELARQPDVELSALARVLGQDPALTAKIMRIAGSPLYASKRRVEHVRHALTLVGLNATISLALGFSLGGLMRSRLDDSAALSSVWQRSVMAAVVARALATALDAPRLEELMLAALLQDIGVLALATLDPGFYSERQGRDGIDMATLAAHETRHFGADHAQVGAWLARHWRFPAYLVEAIAASESEDAPGTFNACIALSGPLAELWLGERSGALRVSRQQQVQARLGLDADGFASVATQVAASLPEMEALFDTGLVEPAALQALVHEARELKELRTLIELEHALRLKHEAAELRDHALAMERRAQRDPLTGLYNRGHFQSLLGEEFATSVEHGWPLALAFLDLDDFKQINDAHGHLVGDEVLARFALTIGTALRESDVVCRYGGEEFLVMLPGTELRSAVLLLRRLLQSIAATPMADADGDIIHVTASAGLAVLDADGGIASPDALVRAADEALYRAKGAGRNQVVVGGPRQS